MRKITPFLWFDQQAEEAATFYVSIFNNSKVTSVNRVDGRVMTVNFELDGQPFVALNGGSGGGFHFNESISFMVDCQDQAEVDYFWDALSEGGEQGPCGWLRDRYGLSWQVIPRRLNELVGGDDAEASQRAMAAMLTMKKIVVADLEAAYAG